MDFNFLKNVAADLRYLLDEWDQEVEVNSLRVSSSIVRRLLTESGGKGDLKKAWRMVGLDREPVIGTYTIEPILANYSGELWSPKIGSDLVQRYRKNGKVPLREMFNIIPGRNHLWFVIAGGAVFRGSSMKGISIAVDYGEHIVENEPITELTGLNGFINSPCIFVLGYTINRAELIRYVVNKMGGGHYDKKRNESKVQDRKFFLFDIFRDTFITRIFDPDMDVAYFELLSIGQSLVESEDVKKLSYEIDALI